MSREIKFRAWDGFNIIDSRDFWISADGHCAIFNEDGNIEYNYWTLIQFTGLEDRNGKDIYEGDIVSGVLYKDYSEHIGKVLYDFNGYRILTNEKSLQLDLTEKLTVIGNIYEHGHLLKG